MGVLVGEGEGYPTDVRALLITPHVISDSWSWSCMARDGTDDPAEELNEARRHTQRHTAPSPLLLTTYLGPLVIHG